MEALQNAFPLAEPRSPGASATIRQSRPGLPGARSPGGQAATGAGQFASLLARPMAGTPRTGLAAMPPIDMELGTTAHLPAPEEALPVPPRPPEAPMPRPAALELPLPPPQAARAARRAMAGPAGGAALRRRLAEAEGTAREPGQGYGVRNRRSGALGRYQMLPIALRDIGWRNEGGAWTARARAAGVRSDADFLASPAAQEAAMADYLNRAEQQLQANGALSRAGQALSALDGRPIRLTEAGLVAAAHRRGAGAVAGWIRHRAETPQAPLSPAQKAMFNSIEVRLRDFADLSRPDAGRMA
jgi:hypothetical protein